LQQNKGPVNSDEWLFLLTGGAASESPLANPALTWLKDKSWGEILWLSTLPTSSGWTSHFC